MNLHSAISTAVKFTWAGKQNSPLKGVRFLPMDVAGHQHIYANRGQQGVMLKVVAGIPNAVMDGEKLAGIVKGGTIEDVKAASGRPNTSVFLCKGGGQYEVAHGDVAAYPPIPQPPVDMWRTSDWWAINQIMHAVSKDKQQPHLQAIHFGDGVVEATDRYRVARVFIDLPVRGLVPIDAFKNWPKSLDSVDLAFRPDKEPDTAWFRMGDETRMSTVLRGLTYPDIDPILPRESVGSAVSVPTDELTDAVKKVAALSPGVLLAFLRQQYVPIRVSGGGFETEIPTEQVRAADEPCSMRVNAKWLLAALKVCETPRVLLGYGHGLDPLRIESGPFIEGIWPMPGS